MLEDNLEKVSLLIGKSVISIFDGEMIGFVKNVVFDKTFSKIEWLEIFDENSDKEYYLNTKDIYSLADVIVIKNNDCLYLKQTLDIDAKNPINFSVFTTEGKKIGKIADVEIDKKLKTQFFIISDKNIALNKILNIGKNIAILQPEKLTKLSIYKSKAKFSANHSKKNNLVTIENKILNRNKITVPKKVLTDNFSFLIGRKLDKNIYTDNKQLIAKKQSIITSQIIDIASKNGKLKELTYSSVI